MHARLSFNNPLGVQFLNSSGDASSTHYPSDIDICCGRGKGNWSHRGNHFFKQIIKQNAQRYSEARSRNDKTIVINRVIELMKQRGARFLKRDEASGEWLDIGEEQAREKTGHAMRDHLSKVAKRSRNSASNDSNGKCQPKTADGSEAESKVTQSISAQDNNIIQITTGEVSKASLPTCSKLTTVQVEASTSPETTATR